jgi:hypothetical protein
MCVCSIATLESLQHVSAYIGHLQVIFYKYRNTNSCLKTSACNGSVEYVYHMAVSNGYGYVHGLNLLRSVQSVSTLYQFSTY